MASTPVWQAVLDEADDETVAAINQLQLQDLQAIESSAESSEGSDAAVARQMYEDEVNQYTAVREAIAEETALADDREGFEDEETGWRDSQALVGGPGGPGGDRQVPHLQLDEILAMDPPAASSPPVRIACDACFESKSEADCFRSTCEDGHAYCKDCLERLFRDCMGDATLYPPKCCSRRIPFEEVKGLLSVDLNRDFEKKQEELDDRDPVYCHDAHCSAYIGVQHRWARIAVCQTCSKHTCRGCYRASHEGACARSEAVQQVEALGERMGWQKCYNCPRWIERNMGCYHMSCPCGAEFCYLCGAEWKTCSCRLMDFDEVIPRAAAIVQRDGNNRNLQEVIEHLVLDPQGQGDTWQKRDGQFVCDGRRGEVSQYIFECLHCPTRLCHRCRCNRGHAVEYRDQIEQELRDRGLIHLNPYGSGWMLN